MRRRLMRMGRTNRGLCDNRGLTLLELVVAVLVLAIGSLAALQAVDQSRRAIGGAMPRLLAQLVAQNRAEELRLAGLSGPSGGLSLPSQVQMGPYSYQLTVSTKATASGIIEAEIRAVSSEGPAVVLVAFLPPPGAG
ncbi:MAG: hypothetical protein COB16_19625 [Rhodobacteraceae bacterium]|nr:MAG: hypothetical protein COB16_19625 [Paracoccaceae bacterium]